MNNDQRSSGNDSSDGAKSDEWAYITDEEPAEVQTYNWISQLQRFADATFDERKTSQSQAATVSSSSCVTPKVSTIQIQNTTKTGNPSLINNLLRGNLPNCDVLRSVRLREYDTNDDDDDSNNYSTTYQSRSEEVNSMNINNNNGCPRLKINSTENWPNRSKPPPHSSTTTHLYNETVVNDNVPSLVSFSHKRKTPTQKGVANGRVGAIVNLSSKSPALPQLLRTTTASGQTRGNNSRRSPPPMVAIQDIPLVAIQNGNKSILDDDNENIKNRLKQYGTDIEVEKPEAVQTPVMVNTQHIGFINLTSFAGQPVRILPKPILKLVSSQLVPVNISTAVLNTTKMNSSLQDNAIYVTPTTSIVAKPLTTNCAFVIQNSDNRSVSVQKHPVSVVDPIVTLRVQNPQPMNSNIETATLQNPIDNIPQVPNLVALKRKGAKLGRPKLPRKKFCLGEVETTPVETMPRMENVENSASIRTEVNGDVSLLNGETAPPLKKKRGRKPGSINKRKSSDNNEKSTQYPDKLDFPYSTKIILFDDGTRGVACNVCGLEFSKSTGAKQHYLRKHIAPEYISDQEKSSPYIYQNQLTEKSKMINNDDDGSGGGKMYYCHLCRLKFENENELQNHFAVNHMAKKTEETLPKRRRRRRKRKNDVDTGGIVAGERKTFIHKCSTCDECFQSNLLFNRHLKHCSSRQQSIPISHPKQSSTSSFPDNGSYSSGNDGEGITIYSERSKESITLTSWPDEIVEGPLNSLKKNTSLDIERKFVARKKVKNLNYLKPNSVPKNDTPVSPQLVTSPVYLLPPIIPKSVVTTSESATPPSLASTLEGSRSSLPLLGTRKSLSDEKKSWGKKEKEVGTCVYCKEVFETPYSRRLHTLKQHHPKKKVFRCVYCTKFDCIIRSQLLNHFNDIHSNEWFGCVVCAKRYLTKKELKDHNEKVHEDKSEGEVEVVDVKVESEEEGGETKVKSMERRDESEEDNETEKENVELMMEEESEEEEEDREPKSKKGRPAGKRKRGRPSKVVCETKLKTSSGTSSRRYKTLSDKTYHNLMESVGKWYEPKTEEGGGKYGINHRQIDREIGNFYRSISLNVETNLMNNIGQTADESDDDGYQIPISDIELDERWDFLKMYNKDGITGNFVRSISKMEITTQVKFLEMKNDGESESEDDVFSVDSENSEKEDFDYLRDVIGLSKIEKEETGNLELGEEDQNLKIQEIPKEVETNRYVCSVCFTACENLPDLKNHRLTSHPNVRCLNHDFLRENTPQTNWAMEKFQWNKNLLLKKDYVESSTCKKCNVTITPVAKLHEHILECGKEGTANVNDKKTKRRLRPFGSRRHRNVARVRGFKRDIPAQPPKGKQRQKAGDSDSIMRMIANLPPKRITRRTPLFEDSISPSFLNRNTNGSSVNHHQSNTRRYEYVRMEKNKRLRAKANEKAHNTRSSNNTTTTTKVNNNKKTKENINKKNGKKNGNATTKKSDLDVATIIEEMKKRMKKTDVKSTYMTRSSLTRKSERIAKTTTTKELMIKFCVKCNVEEMEGEGGGVGDVCKKCIRKSKEVKSNNSTAQLGDCKKCKGPHYLMIDDDVCQKCKEKNKELRKNDNQVEKTNFNEKLTIMEISHELENSEKLTMKTENLGKTSEKFVNVSENLKKNENAGKQLGKLNETKNIGKASANLMKIENSGKPLGKLMETKNFGKGSEILKKMENSGKPLGKLLEKKNFGITSRKWTEMENLGKVSEKSIMTIENVEKSSEKSMLKIENVEKSKVENRLENSENDEKGLITCGICQTNFPGNEMKDLFCFKCIPSFGSNFDPKELEVKKRNTKKEGNTTTKTTKTRKCSVKNNAQKIETTNDKEGNNKSGENETMTLDDVEDEGEEGKRRNIIMKENVRLLCKGCKNVFPAVSKYKEHRLICKDACSQDSLAIVTNNEEVEDLVEGDENTSVASSSETKAMTFTESSIMDTIEGVVKSSNSINGINDSAIQKIDTWEVDGTFDAIWNQWLLREAEKSNDTKKILDQGTLMRLKSALSTTLASAVVYKEKKDEVKGNGGGSLNGIEIEDSTSNTMQDEIPIIVEEIPEKSKCGKGIRNGRNTRVTDRKITTRQNNGNWSNPERYTCYFCDQSLYCKEDIMVHLNEHARNTKAGISNIKCSNEDKFKLVIAGRLESLFNRALQYFLKAPWETQSSKNNNVPLQVLSMSGSSKRFVMDNQDLIPMLARDLRQVLKPGGVSISCGREDREKKLEAVQPIQSTNVSMESNIIYSCPVCFVEFRQVSARNKHLIRSHATETTTERLGNSKTESKKEKKTTTPTTTNGTMIEVSEIGQMTEITDANEEKKEENSNSNNDNEYSYRGRGWKRKVMLNTGLPEKEVKLRAKRALMQLNTPKQSKISMQSS